jgi:transcriptional regulator with PAS, ATPase and Fis domain
MDKTVVMVGVSAAVRAIEEEIRYAARTDAQVLITGESGVGKEVVARSIHQRSGRAHAPLITINCAGFPDTLLESELFGHVKGSFTDASRDKRGWFELAHGGTIFMDEVGEMSLRMQALLLRFLETGEIQRVGSDRPLQRIDVRVIAATNRRLLDSVADKTFREDLYYRLNVVHLEVPPLRQRREDVPALMHHFLRTFASTHRTSVRQISPAALQCLTDYSWPGNVRELKNVAERLVLRSGGGTIEVAELPAEIRSASVVTAARSAAQTQAATSVAQGLFDRMVNGGETFWSIVYEPFVARDLTRDQLRDVVRLGLEHTRGNYKMLVGCFNMAPTDYKRLLSFLRKHQCHVPFQHFRVVPARVTAADHDRDRRTRAASA